MNVQTIDNLEKLGFEYFMQPGSHLFTKEVDKKITLTMEIIHNLVMLKKSTLKRVRTTVEEIEFSPLMKEKLREIMDFEPIFIDDIKAGRKYNDREAVFHYILETNWKHKFVNKEGNRVSFIYEDDKGEHYYEINLKKNTFKPSYWSRVNSLKEPFSATEKEKIVKLYSFLFKEQLDTLENKIWGDNTCKLLKAYNKSACTCANKDSAFCFCEAGAKFETFENDIAKVFKVPARFMKR